MRCPARSNRSLGSAEVAVVDGAVDGKFFGLNINEVAPAALGAAGAATGLDFPHPPRRTIESVGRRTASGPNPAIEFALVRCELARPHRLRGLHEPPTWLAVGLVA